MSGCALGRLLLWAGVFLLALVAGCGGGSSAPPGVAVAVAPKTATVIVTGTQQFFADVSGGKVADIVSGNGAVRAANVVTIKTTSPHGLSVGQSVGISGVADNSFNGIFTITTVPSTTSFTYAQTGSDATSGGGTVSTNAVKWFVDSVEGGNTAKGTISTSGLYTAPAAVPPATTVAITSTGAVRASNVVTITTAAAHNLVGDQVVTISGVTDTSFNGTFNITSVPSTTTFTYSQTASNASSGGGTVASTAVQVKAVAVADTTKSDTAIVSVDSGVRLTVAPSSATVGTSEELTFIPTVTPSTVLQSVKWSVNGVEGGNPTVGTISVSGLYKAPTAIPSPATVTVKAISTFDPTRSGTASTTIVTAANPTLTSISPTGAAQGSLFQDIYLTGTEFRTTTPVLIGSQTIPPAAVTILSGRTLLRVRVPTTVLSPSTFTPLDVKVQSPGPPPFTTPPCSPDPTVCQLMITPVRPALVGASPDSATQGSGAANINVNGGYFGTTTAPGSAAVTGEFDGAPRTAPINNARQLTVNLSSGDLLTPGLIPVAIRNSSVTQPVGAPQQVAVANFAVQPSGAASVLSSPAVGTAPGAVAINTATGIAVVANRCSKDLSRIDLTLPSPALVPGTIPVGDFPTGVAVDNLRGLAVVANSGSNNTNCPGSPPPGTSSISIVNLNTAVEVTRITSNIFTAPNAVAVNPLTGLAIVAYKNANVASIIDLKPATPAVVGVVTVNTSQNPQVAVEPRLNWAIITSGAPAFSTGLLSVADLGRRSSNEIDTASRAGGSVTIKTKTPHNLRPSQAILITGVTDATFNGYFTVVGVPDNKTFTYSQAGGTASSGAGNVFYSDPLATFTVSAGVTGVSINPETEKAVLTDPTTNTVSVLSVLDQSVASINLTSPPAPAVGDNCPSGVVCAVATAVNPLTDTAVSVNFFRNEASVIDTRTPARLGNPIGVGTGPKAVAIDPGSNRAVIANEGSGTVTILNLGSLRPVHITQVSPAATLTSASDLTLTIIGKGFASGSQVRLDGTALTGATIVSDRQITVTVPAASFLSRPRRFALDVVSGSNQSNVTDFAVIHAVATTGTGCTGPAPRGVAIDPQSGPNNNGIAVVTNPGCDNISLIDIDTGSATFGTVTKTVPVGKNPQGVAIISRLGKAVVTNRTDNTATIIKLSDQTVCSTCTVTVGAEPLGVGINPDTATAVVANSAGNTVSLFNADTGGSATSASVNTRPVAVAVDPVRNIAAVVAATGNTVDILDLSQSPPTIKSRFNTGLLPTSVVLDLDPSGGFFIATPSLTNTLAILNPDLVQQPLPLRIGINPTSVAYNFLSDTLVTVNTASNTLSIVDFLNRRVRAVQSFGTVQGLTSSSPSCLNFIGPGPNPIQQPPCGVDIHPRTNLAVIADGDNNRVLLVPLPR